MASNLQKGQVFRVNNNENTLEGYYLSGAMLNYFPLPAPDSIRWAAVLFWPILTGMESKTCLWLGKILMPPCSMDTPLKLNLYRIPLLVGAGGFSWDDSGVDQGSKIHKPGIVGPFVAAIFRRIIHLEISEHGHCRLAFANGALGLESGKSNREN